MVKLGRQVHAQHILMVEHAVPQSIFQVFHRAGTRLAILAQHRVGASAVEEVKRQINNGPMVRQGVGKAGGVR